MKLAFAPHLAGRMLPALFTDVPELRKPRFPGDPWAAQPHWAAWHWMHSTACVRDEHGCLNGLCRSRAIPRALRCDETPSPQAAGNDRPSVGSMGARQPADAGPQQGALFA